MPQDPELLTSQQIALLEYIRTAMPVDQAIRMAGLDFDEAAKFLATDERGSQAVEFAKSLSGVSIKVTKDLITSQMYGAMARSASTMEDMACLREIAKIHGLYETKINLVNGVPAEENENQTALKAMYRKTDDELIAELSESGGTLVELLPQKIDRGRKSVTIDMEQDDE